MVTAPTLSLKMLTAVRTMSSGRSKTKSRPIPATRVTPSGSVPGGRAFSTPWRITMMATRLAAGTPATPMLVSRAMMTIMNCWAKPSSMPKAWQMKMAATHS